MEKLEQQREGVDIKLLKEKINDIYEDPEKYEKIVEFAQVLRGKYEDFQDYLLYHVLIGSTPFHELPKVDFPGDDSVEKFIDSLWGK